MMNFVGLDLAFADQVALVTTTITFSFSLTNSSIIFVVSILFKGRRIIQGGPHEAPGLTTPALFNMNVLPWSARSPDLFPIEHKGDIIGLQRQRLRQPELNNLILTDQERQVYSSLL
ncbi:hypothetical protein TNCV_707941 [Trichonephila clavipes]|nr:hypothetical protein TNCV_707941 [Trichonephila clavipes]